jgi:TetR/AcrR family transcriptional regulator
MSDQETEKALQASIQQLELEGRVSRTFRRLDPDRQLAVINAIVEEAADRSPGRLNVKRVAGRAGVSVGSLYQYFKDRDELLGFAVEICVRTMLTLFEQSRPYLIAMPLREALSAYLSYGIEWSGSQKGFVRFFGRAAYSGDAEMAEPLVRPIAAMMREIMRDVFASAAARGEIRADVDVEAASRVVNALFIAIGDSALMPHINGYFQVADETMPMERIVPAAVDLVLRGIGAE